MLNIENVSKSYGNKVKALNNINLRIDNGMFGLLGPNGAGKSSLMRTIACLQLPDSGDITFNGVSILDNPDGLRKQLGYLPQDFGLYPKVTASMFLMHLAELKGISNKSARKELVGAMLQRVNLWESRDKYLGTYSGGMRQRFGIAQALIGNPKLIIVDEPTAGLDPAERNRFYNLLSELGENTVVILSTHIVEDVTTLCSNMAIICLGEVLASGNPKSVISSIEGKIWQKVVGRADLALLKEQHQVISTYLISGNILVHIYSENNPLDGFEPVKPNLEDAYFSTIASKVNLITI